MKKSFIIYLISGFFVLAFHLRSFSQLSGINTPPGFKYVPDANLPVLNLPVINRDSMLAEDAVNERLKGHPYRFGYNHMVYLKPDNSGTWTALTNGDRIWQMDIKTNGGQSINLGFTDFSLQPGAKLFLYSKDGGQVLGAYTSANNTPDKFFGTELIKGDEAVLEYYEPASARGKSNFTLFRITQGYRSIHKFLKESTGFGGAGPCIPNVNCPECYNFATQKRAVVCVVINGGEFCSGSLVNNTRNDGTPYILTANHCVTGTVDGTWVFRFNWEAPGCSDPDSDPAFEIVTGATLVAKNGVSDFALVKMDTTPPPSYHAFYAGWNYGLTPASSVTVIHHPEGDIKKCTQAANPVTDTFYDAGNGPAQVWQIGEYTSGATEPGSSGSPLFDQNKRIVGQLYGGPSDCDVPAYDLRDYYGRFCVSWDSGSTPQTRLKDWLDPNSTGDSTNDGFDPNPPADTNDIELNTVVMPVNGYCTPTITPSILVTNIGTATVTGITINYHVDNAADSAYVWTGNLISQANVTINLPPLPVTPGIHNFYANINLPVGMVDQNLYNDSIITVFTVFDHAAIAVPFFEGFEAAFPPANWTITTPPSGTTWTQTMPGGFGQSGHSAVVNEFAPLSSTAGETPSLISPPVNMSNVSGQPFLKFDVAYAPYNALSTDSLAVLVSTDCGSSWAKIYQKGGNSLSTSTYSDTLFVPLSSQWRKDSVNIANLAGQPSVLFDFEVISGYGNTIYVDNIDIADTSQSAGILPVTDNIQVRVYPNPFTQNFNLVFSLDAAQTINAGVYAVDGKKLIAVLDNAKPGAGMHQLEINTSQLSSGLYILKVNEQFFKLEKLK